MTRPLLILALSLLLCSAPLHAQKKKAPSQHPRLAGLSLAVDAGLLIPSNKQANFYSGRPGNANTIDRVLRSQQYGTQIWNSLVDQQLISPSAIPSYSAFRIADGGYPQMHYKLTYQIGFGLRYDYSSGWAWSLAFDFSQVTAAGQFLLSSDNGVGIPGSRQYVACDIFGLEKRILIDFSVSKSLPLTNLLDLEMAAGIGVNNTKVSENAMVISSTYGPARTPTPASAPTPTSTKAPSASAALPPWPSATHSMAQEPTSATSSATCKPNTAATTTTTASPSSTSSSSAV